MRSMRIPLAYPYKLNVFKKQFNRKNHIFFATNDTILNFPRYILHSFFSLCLINQNEPNNNQFLITYKPFSLRRVSLFLSKRRINHFSPRYPLQLRRLFRYNK